MAHILNAAAHRSGRDSFQDELAFALSIPVVRIAFATSLWSVLTSFI